MTRIISIFAALLICAVAGCEKNSATATSSPAPAPDTNRQTFQARGVIHELKPDGRTVVIQHEEITNYMAAMVMPFEVQDTNELRGLQAGDTVSFRMVVTETDGWIERVQKLDAPRVEIPAPLPPSLRVVRDVAPLNTGDALPDYHFTNELGQAVSLAQFRGRALAITFIFTRCPFPTFCPLMCRNFLEAQKKLKELLPPSGSTANWQLLTITFDPEFDTPAVLREYAARSGYDPARWSFLTGALMDITAITEQFGVQFWRENPGEPLSHNLRTVVVDTQGRVQKIIPNNDWNSDELVAEMLKAAAVK